jgi:hypothetical protein
MALRTDQAWLSWDSAETQTNGTSRRPLRRCYSYRPETSNRDLSAMQEEVYRHSLTATLVPFLSVLLPLHTLLSARGFGDDM